MASTTRRSFLQTLGGAGLMAAACGPGAAAPAPAPAGGPGPEDPAWEQLVAAAQREGALVVVTGVAASFERPLQRFQEAFPSIKTERVPINSASILAPKVIEERKGGIYSFDVTIGGGNNTYASVLLPEGVWDPVREAILPRPELVADDKWIAGYEWGFVQEGRKWTYAYAWQKNSPWWINTDLVRESEIRSFHDLLDPKWKGKIISIDVRNGGVFNPMTVVRLTLGADYVKRFVVDQQPLFNRERRYVTEQMVRGNFPIANGVDGAILEEFLAQGLGKNLKRLNIPNATYLNVDTTWLFNKAPHPNAARLFINWFLSRQGQLAWLEVEGAESNSRRSDVPVKYPDTALTAGEEKIYLPTGSMIPEVEETKTLLNQLALR